MLRHRAFCQIFCITVYMHEGFERQEQDRVFVLINQGQRRSSNLGFRMLHAEQQRNTFMSKYCRYISAEFCRYNTLAIRHIGRYISVCRYISQALLVGNLHPHTEYVHASCQLYYISCLTKNQPNSSLFQIHCFSSR